MSSIDCGGYISEISLNDGKRVDVRKNDIVLFVGPNNAGKSQALRDIYSISGNGKNGIVIKDVHIQKYTTPIKTLLDRISVGQKSHGRDLYHVLGKQYSFDESTNSYYQGVAHYWAYRDLFVSNLNTEARLSICMPAANIPRNTPKDNPIHYAAFEGKYRKWLSESFQKAFKESLIPNTNHGGNIPLCIGEPVKLEDKYDDEQSRQEAYAEILDGYKQVQDQGDGIKSFTGILLYLMMDHFCTYLIDEPESFLHPPQARIMGQIIGETLRDNQQAFISTHSEEIIKGLLETCPERLKIIRITRDKDVNHFSILSNDKLRLVWSDPLLKHSEIMTGLFHETVVLCESDSDCQMYSIMDSYLKQAEGKYSETLFLHCGGKQRMAKIITALRSIDILVKVITDFDVLNDESVIKGIAVACGISWDNVSKDYSIFISNLHCKNDTINRNNAFSSIKSIFEGSKNTSLSKEEIKRIHEVIATESIWSLLKKSGKSALPAGDATGAFNRFNQAFVSAGLFIVPCGELECFIKEVGGHGPVWVNTVLEKYPEFGNPVYGDLLQFVKELNI